MKFLFLENVVNVISISGGKDSTATALKAIELGASNLRFVFADTGHEHKITYDHIEYLDGVFRSLCGRGIDRVKADFTVKIYEKKQKLKAHLLNLDGMGRCDRRLKQFTAPMLERMIDALEPTGNPFIDLCIWKGRFASTRSRFCSQELKHNVLDAHIEGLVGEFDAAISWQGVRRDESAARRDLPERDVQFGGWEPEPFGLLIYRPILDWSAGETFAIADRFDVKPNPLYKMGMGRVGCMPCIHASKNEVREIERRFPDVIDYVVKAERLVSLASKHGASTFMDARITAKYLGTGKTVDDIKPETHGFKTYVEYARTERGGRKQSLIAAINLESTPACSSHYGLCE